MDLLKQKMQTQNQAIPQSMQTGLLNNPFVSKIKTTMNMLKSAKNPELFMQNMISQNPQMKQAMDYVNANGGNAKEAFYKLAQENGIDPEQILNMLK